MSDDLGKQIEALRNDVVTVKAELSRLKEEKAKYESYLAPAYWALGVLGKNHNLLELHRDQIAALLKQEQPPQEQPYSEYIGQRITEIMKDELTKYKALVPRNQLTLATFTADSLKWQLGTTVEPFIKNPKKLNLEQRRLLLQTFIENGLTKENFEEYRNQTAIPWRKCPTHKVDLKFNIAKLKWDCPISGCNYSE